MSYFQASNHSVTVGLKNTMLYIGTPLVVTHWRNLIHSWRSWWFHIWSCCGPHRFPLFSKWFSQLEKYFAIGMTCASWLSFTINDSSVSVFKRLMPLLCWWPSLFASILDEKNWGIEYACLTLGMFFVLPVFSPPKVSLGRVDSIV